MEEIVYISNFNSLLTSLNYVINRIQGKYENLIVVPTFNRIDYIKQTFSSLIKTVLNNTLVLIIDDKSDNNTKQFIKHFDFIDKHIIRFFKNENKNMHNSFLYGFDFGLNIRSIKYLITLDSDTIHKPNWLEKELELFKKINDDKIIVTGFNTSSHPIKKSHKDFIEKKSIGGINMIFERNFYKNEIKEILVNVKRGWDWEVIFYFWKKNYKLYCTKPSVIQHIGIQDIYNKNKKLYDKATDF